MTTEQSRWSARVVGLVGVFAGLVLGLLSATSPARIAYAVAPLVQQKDQKDEKKAFPKPPEGEFELYGASNCKTCHNQKSPQDEDEYKKTRGYEFVRLWENKIWSAHDLHRNAYQNLWTTESKAFKEWKAEGDEEKPKPNPTAERMEKNLRQAGSNPKYKVAGYTVAADTQCLACHASSNAPITKGIIDKGDDTVFAKDEGVGCEMCHGHGSKYGPDQHKRNIAAKGDDIPLGATRTVPWREFPPQEKQSWGMVNLRDPSRAMQQCASCHIGNLDAGRFVTHEMYAAGHPPLPPLDLVAYTREQPRHWGLPKDLPYFDWLTKTHPNAAVSIYSIHPGESHVTRRFVESTIAGLRSSVVLSQQLADLGKDVGMDFAAFDCASCHHNLKYPSDRQERGYVGVPGRPLFRPAAFVMAKVVTEHASTMEGGPEFKKAYEDLLKAEKALLAAFAVKSLGDAAEIKKAAAGIEAWSTETLKLLGKVKYDDKQAKALLAKLVAATQQPVADPEVAQLLTWGVETLALDQLPAGAENKMPAPLAQLDKSLKPFVVTRLREGNMFPFEVKPGSKGPTLDSVDKRIGDRMKIFNSFESATFKKAFLDVRPELTK